MGSGLVVPLVQQASKPKQVYSIGAKCLVIGANQNFAFIGLVLAH